jgi:hypothetical protein
MSFESGRKFFRKAFGLKDRHRKDIKGYLYPILYPKSGKKDISYPFLERDIMRILYPNFGDFKISYPYPILYPFFNIQCQPFLQHSVPEILSFRGKRGWPITLETANMCTLGLNFSWVYQSAFLLKEKNCQSGVKKIYC